MDLSSPSHVSLRNRLLFPINIQKVINVSDKSETPAAPSKVRFSDLHPGERFAYRLDWKDKGLPVFMKITNECAACSDTARLLEFDDGALVEIYAIDRELL